MLENGYAIITLAIKLWAIMSIKGILIAFSDNAVSLSIDYLPNEWLQEDRPIKTLTSIGRHVAIGQEGVTFTSCSETTECRTSVCTLVLITLAHIVYELRQQWFTHPTDCHGFSCYACERDCACIRCYSGLWYASTLLITFRHWWILSIVLQPRVLSLYWYQKSSFDLSNTLIQLPFENNTSKLDVVTSQYDSIPYDSYLYIIISIASLFYPRRRSSWVKILVEDDPQDDMLFHWNVSVPITLDKESCGVCDRLLITHVIAKYLATDGRRTAVPSSDRTDKRVRPS